MIFVLKKNLYKSIKKKFQRGEGRGVGKDVQILPISRETPKKNAL